MSPIFRILALTLAICGITACQKENDAVNESSSDPIAQIQSFIDEQQIDKSDGHWRTFLKKPPQATFDPSKNYIWTLTTNKGVMKFKLNTEVAPMHVSSTIYLTLLGFYDGLTFHRVIMGFMAQGGCPQGTGSGSPGYSYDGEFSPSVRHDRPGLLSMANRGPGTDGSQFFITFVPTAHLDDKHTIFGELIEGKETLDLLEANGSPPSGGGKTRVPLTLDKAEITVE